MRTLLHPSSNWLAACAIVLGSCASPAARSGGVTPRTEVDREVTGSNADGEGQGLQQVLVTAPDGERLEGVEVWLVDPREVAAERAVVASRTLGDWVEASRAMATAVAWTDAEGMATFPGERDAGYLVAARQGALFGLVERTAPPARGERTNLQLLARAAYPVLVRDASGAPAPGVALTLAAPDPATPDRPFPLPATAFTDESGLATLYEPPAIAEQIFEGLDQVPERMALIRIPAEGLPSVPLDPGGERVEVTLPVLRPVEIRCRHAAFSDEHWAGLIQVFLASDGSRSKRTLAQPFDGGRLSMPHVTATDDLRLIAVVSEASAPERFIGTLTLVAPLDPNASKAGSAARVIELPLDAGLLITGRCLDASGAALANATIDLFVVGDASTSWTEVTDAEGRFRWLLTRPGQPLARVVIGARTRGDGRQIKATNRLGEVTAGEVVDVGVLTLR